ncbi:MAG: tyrosine--tRNA ligase [Candidatus Pacebacteria bacterium]|nr:tyrosine--tRNA ligase [Candidatus Paceibacterota bacterium]
MTKNQKIKELLERGIEEVIVKSHLEKRLKDGKKLRVKFGIDPTSPDLHLGHSIALRKLKQFQEMGHKIIFLIGDFTAMVGDPSGRSEARKPLSEREIKKNMEDYKKQAAKILDMKKVELRYNSEWYEKSPASFLTDLSSRFTLARLMERDDFQKRIKKDVDITMLELTYPLLQGYDSVALKADLELGGTDQKFNLLMGRKVQKKYDQSQQDIMTVPLLLGIDGSRKMSKSFKNYIGITEPAEKMYSKIMSIPDIMIWHYFKLLTDVPLEEIEGIRNQVYKLNLNPRDAKVKLAKEIVTMYHGEKAAGKAEKEFNNVFKDKKNPTKMPIFVIVQKTYPPLDLLFALKLVSSKKEAKRVISQGGMKIDGKVEKNWKGIIEIKNNMVVQVGKRKFAKIKKS